MSGSRSCLQLTLLGEWPRKGRAVKSVPALEGPLPLFCHTECSCFPCELPDFRAQLA